MDSLPVSLKDILHSCRIKHYPKGQIIVYENDRLSEVLIIKSGVVKLYDIDNQGNEKILHIVSSPALIPFAFFSSENSEIRWFYSALTDCDMYVLEQSNLREIMCNDCDIARSLVSNFSQDVHELLVRLSSLGKTVAYDKVVIALRFLLVCHAVQRPNGWWRVPFPVSHQLLANMAGITRESTATVMKDLQDNKIIRNTRLTILEINREKLLENVAIS